MNRRPMPQWLPATWLGPLTMFTALAGGVMATQAQDSVLAGAKKTYTKSGTFHLPVQMDARTRESLKEVALYVKCGTGDWVRQETASPSISFFKYTVPQDGEYWFTLVTIDQAGKASPADVAASPPDQMVIVDTRPPALDIQPWTNASGELCLRCTILDPNPDAKSLRAVCVTPAGEIALEPVNGMPGVFRPQGRDCQGFPVHVSAADLAGNKAARAVMLQDMATGAKPAAATETVTTMSGHLEQRLPTPSTPPRTEPMLPLPAAFSNRFTPDQVLYDPAQPAPASNQESTPAPLPALPPLKSENAPGRLPDPGLPRLPLKNTGLRQVLNTTRASMEYRLEGVGPSGIGKIEIYATTDQGNTWQKIGEDSDRRSPAEIDLPGEGQFGIRLAVTNGNGFGGTTPARGDQPTFVLEVDMTNPFVQLRPIESMGQNGCVEIRWSASDRNLGPEPVSLYYRTRGDASWQPIARNLKNQGLYHWNLPRDVNSQFFLKVEVIDQAGNLGRAETPNPVFLDMAEPRAIVVGVSPVNPR